MPLSSLNSEQLEAATAKKGYNLIIASAGTGKTSTILGRIAYLLKNGFDPKDILLLTFTNKAASEMIQRLGSYFSKDITSQIEAGTFHAVSYRYLKSSGAKILLKDPKELKTLFKSIYEKRNFAHISDTKPYSANYVYELYSLYLNTSSDDFKKWISTKNSEHEVFADIYEDVIEEFKQTKDHYGYAGYDDLLLKFIEYAKSLDRDLFKEVLVDEYQDTNYLQYRVIEALKAPSLFCVGDYDQSIYAFNGADINIIAGFQQRHSSSSVFSLKKNYRSTATILALADSVIKHNERIYPKNLEVARGIDGESPKLLIYNDIFSQYESISNKIKSSITPLSEIAVIFRNNASADGMEASLRELGIPAKRRGGISFFDAKEIKLVLNICSIYANSKDMMSFIDVMSYGKGIGSAIAKELFDALMELGGSVKGGFFNPKDIKSPFKKRVQNSSLGLFDDFYELGSASRFTSLNLSESFAKNPLLTHPKLSSESVQFIYDFYTLLKVLSKESSPKSILDKIEDSRFFDSIASLLAKQRGKRKDGSIDEAQEIDAKARIKRKVALLKNLSLHYDDIYRFLNAMVLGSREMSEGDGVNLLTVHASKGLEFKEVYVVDLMEGRFPNAKLIQKGGSLEEERRLFYVASTRAKDRLFLSYAKYDPIRKTDFVASTFLYEAGLLKK